MPRGPSKQAGSFDATESTKGTRVNRAETYRTPSLSDSLDTGRPGGFGLPGGGILLNTSMLTMRDCNGDAVTMTYQEWKDEGILPRRLASHTVLDVMRQAEGTFGCGDGGGGAGGYGGSGAVGPVYQKPDERLVREAVKGQLSSLSGKVDQGKLDSLTDLYMSEHKRSWDVRETEQVDPMESVKAKVRETSEYKAIHQLRPESMDEYDWVGSRQGALTRAGVTPQLAEELGIAQATVGASTQEATTAGNIATFAQSGQQLDELRYRMTRSTQAALRLI